MCSHVLFRTSARVLTIVLVCVRVRAHVCVVPTRAEADEDGSVRTLGLHDGSVRRTSYSPHRAPAWNSKRFTSSLKSLNRGITSSGYDNAVCGCV